MTLDIETLLGRFSRSETPETTRDIILEMGFNGILFQRWYPEDMDNWEAYLKHGFLELYYSSELYKVCPLAKALNSWKRDFTFAEARANSGDTGPGAKKAEALFNQFEMLDGIVLLTGTNQTKSAVFVTTDNPVQEIFENMGAVLAYAARRLERQLPPGSPFLQKITRSDPQMSALQKKIVEMQIAHPEMSNQDMAAALNMSPKTLHSHHKKIARKNGVTTFAGAVIKHMAGS